MRYPASLYRVEGKVVVSMVVKDSQTVETGVIPHPATYSKVVFLDLKYKLGNVLYLPSSHTSSLETRSFS